MARRGDGEGEAHTRHDAGTLRTTPPLGLRAAPSLPLPAAPRVVAELARRGREFQRLAQDPVLLTGLVGVGLFILLFILWPLGRVIWQGVFLPTGEVNVEQYRRYLDPFYGRLYRQVFWDTLQMGVYTALGGTVLGFIFAYAVVRCDIPFRQAVHVIALLPTISPPFAIAIATILLFGRNGLVTARLLGINFRPGVNDVYGLDGLVIVQIVTFFSVAYLILRGMLERLDPAFEEAAHSLGASKWHIFRTVTLPLLVPGFASSILLLFVEALADLGNPLLIAGNTTVLSSQIWIAVNGEYDQVKGAALSVMLLIPTLTVFILQRYWVSRRSYVSVTGKPTGGRLGAHDPRLRWAFITLTALASLLIVALYGTIAVGSLTKVWGADYSLDLRHYGTAIARGLKALLDTSFLAAVATPIAGIIGMVAAWLIVRRAFSGREALDFASTLGGAVPGTILGIGYIIAFIRAPLPVVAVAYFIVAVGLAAAASERWLVRALVVLAGVALGYGLTYVRLLVADATWPLLQAGLWALLAGVALAFEPRAPGEAAGAASPWRRVSPLALLFLAFGAYLWLGAAVASLAAPLALWGRSLPGVNLPKMVDSLVGWLGVLFQPPPALLGLTYAALSALAVVRLRGLGRALVAASVLALSYAMTFVGEPLALVGTPYIVLAAYAVRSLPAAVRAGVAQLQQIDPAIEEASTSLGADASITFRRVTLPLILPAFLAGLIFAFARHMTSLSAIIFLSTPKWPILTALILSEVEQGGMSLAAAYSVILIAIVLGAIGLMYLILGRTLALTEGVDLSLGVG